MDALGRLIGRWREQLGGLNRSQQLVIGLCCVVIAGSLLWLTQWTSRPPLTPLIPGASLTSDEIARLTESLDRMGVEYEATTDNLLVPIDQRYFLINQLNSQEALPQKIRFSFEDLFNDSSPFRPESENEMRQLVALNHELAKIISASPDVADADVLISAPKRRAIGRSATPSTASVSITMQPGKSLDDERVRGIARLVSGAVSGLEPHMVSVVDGATGRHWTIPSPDDDPGFGLLAERKKVENHYREKVLEQLSYIPGVLVAISAELEADRTTKTTMTWDSPQVKSDASTSTETASGSKAGEPGTNANVGIALTSGEANQSSASDETKTEFFNQKPKDQTVTQKGRFIPKRVTAAINVPRSFVVSIFKAATNAEAPPTDTDLEDYKTSERTRIQGLVKRVLMTSNNEDVQVDFFYDLAPGGEGFVETPGGMAMASANGSPGIWSQAQNYLPEAGLGLLGLIGILSMVQMVRKSSHVTLSRKRLEVMEEELPPTDEDGVLSVGNAALGMAEVSEGYLTGHEIDDETLRNQELRTQVSKLVADNPQNAADLIRRWVESSN